VKDMKVSSLNDWKFAVRVPPKANQPIVVQPTAVPGKKVGAGVERRSVSWQPATINPHKRQVYCKVFLADPSKERNKVGVRRGQRKKLPSWIKKFKYRLRLKSSVTPSTWDANAQVLLVHKGNHVQMIRMFFALRVWVLSEGFAISAG